MNISNRSKTLASLSTAFLMATAFVSPAQACLPFMSGGAGNSSCQQAQAPKSSPSMACDRSHASKPGAEQSCPIPQGKAAGLINPELVAAVGDMAAGGMQIATHMMRVLADEVGRYAALGEDAVADTPEASVR